MLHALPSDEADLFVDLAEGLVGEIRCALSALLVDAFQIRLIAKHLLGFFADGTDKLDNGFADGGLEDAVALICKLCLGLLNGLAGGGAVDRKEIRDAGFVFLVKADGGLAVGHGALAFAHDILGASHEGDAAVGIGL